MTLIVARFDLDESVLASNTDRPTPQWSVLPNRFPFLVDDETGEIVEPVLVHLLHKFAGARSYKEGRWVHQSSADAAAADLKDWWETLSQMGVDWRSADAEYLDKYLLDLQLEPSPHTEDFLTATTQARRRSSINEFHAFARVHWQLPELPTAARARSLVGFLSSGRSDGHTSSMSVTIGGHRHKTDADPRPFDIDDLARICDALGPLPSEIGERAFERQVGAKTSGPRLAFELAIEAGLRIDEIVSLRRKTIEGLMVASEEDGFATKVVKLSKTKGLVKRKAYIPVWLVRELWSYIRIERELAVRASTGLGRSPPDNLFLNSLGARGNVGKRLTAKTIEAKLLEIQHDLGITRRRIKAEGTEWESTVQVARHSFHDARHTYAYLLYLSLKKQNDPAPWIIVKLRLGHAQVSTTIDIYLDVFSEQSSNALRMTNEFFAAARRRHGAMK